MQFMRDEHRYIAFGGARGGGKSWAVRAKSVLMAAYYPGIKIMIMRRTYPELKNNHIDELLKTAGNAVRYNKTDKNMIFPNGSRIQFGYAQNENDLGRYQGTECDVLFIDEATQFTEEQFDRMKAFVRGVNDFPKRIYLTCNPGGVGHAWVKRLFIDRNFKANEKPEDYSFIRSLVTDNKALMEADPGYLDFLNSLPPKLRKAWMEGDWNIFEGQFFEEFRTEPDLEAVRKTSLSKDELLKQRKYTHVIEPFDIPRGWNIVRSFDFGYAKPFSCDWWAIDYEGRAYLIDQLYGVTNQANEGVKWHPDKIFSTIRKYELEHKNLRGREIYGVADPSIWDASRGDAIIEFAYKNYLNFEKGDNRRVPGWMQCHYRFAFDENGYPLVYFFSTCKDAIRTIPTLQFDEHDPEDLDTKQEDHFADSYRYFCMSRPITPKHEEVAGPVGDDPLDLRGYKYVR